MLWLGGLAGLLALGVQHAPALWDHAARWMATPRYALLAALLYIPIKLVHELSHGLAVRRWGGHVHDAGITLMMGLPVPYVNASAASSFVEPRHRMAVSAAGIMAELAIAAVALPLWLWLEPGLARDVAFVTLVVTTVSTLLFNANPLQRLDGYYIATDWLELPNLGPRSRAWWLDWLRRRLLRLPDAEPMPLAAGERGWLIAYAPLSWLYTIAITAAAVLWLGHVSLVLGAVAAVVLAALLVLRPVWALIGQLARSAQAQRRAGARLRLAGGLAAALLVGVLVLPMPHYQLARGVVWPADRAQVRAESAGFVGTLHRRDGDRVQAGELIVQLLNPQLQSDHSRQLARVSALESELFQALASDPAAAAKTRTELDAAQSELGQLDDKLAGLAVRAQVAGRLALPATGDLTDRYVAARTAARPGADRRAADGARRPARRPRQRPARAAAAHQRAARRHAFGHLVGTAAARQRRRGADAAERRAQRAPRRRCGHRSAGPRRPAHAATGGAARRAAGRFGPCAPTTGKREHRQRQCLRRAHRRSRLGALRPGARAACAAVRALAAAPGGAALQSAVLSRRPSAR